MGISGLLPLLREIHAPTHVDQYRGRTLGVDAYVWLHKGAYSCATDLALGKESTRYASTNRMLQHYGVRPYVVFDGGYLPSKRHTESERESRRREQRTKGLELLGASRMSEARDAFVRSIDVTPKMAHELIKALRQAGVPYVVAPYEADAQLAFLEKVGLIDGVITEDSDLLVFGCSTVLFKLDTYGNCVEVRRERFAEVKQVAFDGWGAKEFRQMAILSGCDYLPSIAGMGLRVAHRLLRRYESVEHVLRAVRLEGKMRVPHDYEEQFRRAELTFVHQRVWDPRGEGQLTTLEPLPESLTDQLVPFIGEPLPAELARAIARGDVDPISHKPLGAQVRMTTPDGQKTIHSFFARPLADKDMNRQPQPQPAAVSDVSATHAQKAERSAASSSPADVFDTFDRSSSPVKTPPPTPPRCDEFDCLDGVVSSPVSSPVVSPERGAAKRHADSEALRRDWLDRFSFSGKKARLTPGPSPRAPVRRIASDSTPTRKTLQLTQRSISTPRIGARTPAPKDVPATPAAVPSTPRPVTPASSTGSGAARLLRFKYTDPTTPS
ncbi:hypothetical protein MCUN1_002160 [Malassezia cuniculi]|uniref:Exonuclease 1 n=1 Tax=Malassezia cuniculi TaxID=948313 RepID=A0AAF0J748_9BASI|nr:hypothetical protein MCUN1_002160 [Malassezia cuniculi]